VSILGRWTGGSISITPSTSWAAPSGLFPTQQRNDSSAYSFASASSSLTLPSSNLADGYLVVGRYEFIDTSNGRFNPQGRIIQTSGTGNFAASAAGGFNRDSSENRSYVSTWAFIDSPSASAVFQFQWKSDTDAPTGGTGKSSIDVIPLFYSDRGVYTSNDSNLLGGTTPNILSSWSTVADGTNITRSGDTITTTGQNKRYLTLGGEFYEGRGGRTQRWFGITKDGAQINSAKAYSYYRNVGNDESGNMFTYLYESSTSDIDIELNCYRGDGTGAGQGGAGIDGAIPNIGNHALVILELNDTAEVFYSVDDLGGIDLNVTAPVDHTIARTTGIEIEDTASWSRASDTAFQARTDMDALIGFNISAAQELVATTTRWTCEANLTVNGTEDDDIFHGNYGRNSQGSQGCYGWSANTTGFVALSQNDQIGASTTELPLGEDGGQFEVQPDWSGFWGINLDTLEEPATAAITAGQNEVGDTQSAILKSLVQLQGTQSESGDTQSASLSVQATAAINATQNEAGDTQSAILKSLVQLQGAQTEAGDTQAAAITTQQTAEISASQNEVGDTQNAVLKSLVQLQSAQNESGDTQSASLGVGLHVSANQPEAGDTQTADLSVGLHLSVDQSEQGDTQSASLSVGLHVSASQVEAGDQQNAQLAVLNKLLATQAEQGDTQTAALTGVVTASITAAQSEQGDTQNADISVLAGLQSIQSEAGDTQNASIEVLPLSLLSAIQSEAGDTQNSQIIIPHEISANTNEAGDTQAATLTVSVTLSANQNEQGDQQAAKLGAIAAIDANQIEQGDTQEATIQTTPPIYVGEVTIDSATKLYTIATTTGLYQLHSSTPLINIERFTE